MYSELNGRDRSSNGCKMIHDHPRNVQYFQLVNIMDISVQLVLYLPALDMRTAGKKLQIPPPVA
jgi:hypothetical protein